MRKDRSIDKKNPKKSKKNRLHDSRKGKSKQASPTSVPSEISDNAKIVAILEARAESEREKQAHRKFVWGMIAKACAIGQELSDDEEAWSEFCALDWGKLKGPKVDL